MNETSQVQPEAQDPKSKLQEFAPYAMIAVGVAVAAVRFPQLALQALAFIVTLGVLVFVHEWGHYQFARWAGMKVNRFGIGFPPWVFTVRRNNIDYSIGALPIGGMVDIAGLGSEEEMMGTATTGEAPGNARNPDAPFGQKNFQDAGLIWRFLTLFAGPLMNFLFAIIVAVLLFCVFGMADMDSTHRNRVHAVQIGLPAEKAGIQPGDLIIGVGGKKMDKFEDIAKAIRSNGPKPLDLLVKRGDQVLTQHITPVLKETDRLDGKGKEKAPIVGIEFGVDWSRVEYKRVGFVEAVSRSWTAAYGMTSQIVGMLGRAATFRLSKEERDQIGGPVKIAQQVGSVAKEGNWRDSLALGVALSINLGLLNLLPFPALDGGRILFLGYELIMRRPFDPRKEGIIHMAGMILLLAFMLFITLRDVVSLL
jgi:regulator of sigma E protease